MKLRGGGTSSDRRGGTIPQQQYVVKGTRGQRELQALKGKLCFVLAIFCTLLIGVFVQYMCSLEDFSSSSSLLLHTLRQEEQQRQRDKNLSSESEDNDDEEEEEEEEEDEEDLRGIDTTSIGVLSAKQLLQQSLSRMKYKVHYVSGDYIDRPVTKRTQLEKSEATIVTFHFRIESNPPTDTEYAWISHLLTVKDNMIIFTHTPKLVERMLLLRSLWPRRTIVIEIMNLKDLPIYRLGDESTFWSKQLQLDPTKSKTTTTLEQPTPSYEFYWLHLSKTWFVNQVITKFNKGYFDSVFFYYTDIDLFKTKKFLNARLVQRPVTILPEEDTTTRRNSTLLFMSKYVPNPPTNPISNIDPDSSQYYHIGTMIAGFANAWQSYHEKFSDTIDQFLKKPKQTLFIGDANQIMQSTCQQYLHSCSYVLSSDVPDDTVKGGLRTVLSKGNNFKKYQFYHGQPGYEDAGNKKGGFRSQQGGGGTSGGGGGVPSFFGNQIDTTEGEDNGKGEGDDEDEEESNSGESEEQEDNKEEEEEEKEEGEEEEDEEKDDDKYGHPDEDGDEKED